MDQFEIIVLHSKKCARRSMAVCQLRHHQSISLTYDKFPLDKSQYNLSANQALSLNFGHGCEKMEGWDIHIDEADGGVRMHTQLR